MEESLKTFPFQTHQPSCFKVSDHRGDDPGLYFLDNFRNGQDFIPDKELYPSRSPPDLSVGSSKDLQVLLESHLDCQLFALAELGLRTRAPRVKTANWTQLDC